MKNSSMMLLGGSISAIVTVPPNCLIYRQVSNDHGADLRLLLIIRRVISSCYSSLAELLSNEKPPQNAFLELKHENGIKRE
jgi:hypothetical protein